MKVTDNYNAKYAIWAKEQPIMALPKMTLPFKFPPQKFQSYKEMNDWKKKLIIKIAKQGGVIWSK
jgi:hypothetical protein